MPQSIIQLQGGLGNQLFQYSLGCYLEENGFSVTYNLNLLLNPSKITTRRTFALTRLKIPACNYGRYTIRIKHYLGYQRYVDNPTFTLHTLPKGNHIADGYWQHPQYAQAARSAILSALPVLPISNMGISLGIRRGDYVHDEQTSKFHNSLPQTYYKKALSLFPNDLPITIFTDDPDWVNEIFIPELKSPSIPDLNLINRIKLAPDLPPWETLSLMSQAPYHIIANSTFHWWGAFLSPNGHKIAPLHWNKDFTTTRCGILPTSWLTI